MNIGRGIDTFFYTLITIVVVLLVAAIGTGCYFWFRSDEVKVNHKLEPIRNELVTDGSTVDTIYVYKRP